MMTRQINVRVNNDTSDLFWRVTNRRFSPDRVLLNGIKATVEQHRYLFECGLCVDAIHGQNDPEGRLWDCLLEVLSEMDYVELLTLESEEVRRRALERIKAKDAADKEKSAS